MCFLLMIEYKIKLRRFQSDNRCRDYRVFVQESNQWVVRQVGNREESLQISICA